MLLSLLHTRCSWAGNAKRILAQRIAKRNRTTTRIFITLVLGIGILNGLPSFVCAQDLHFSQFFNSPLTTNPANTGFLPEYDYRLGANYRQQWASIPAQFKTMSIYGDAQAFRDRFESGWVGLGGAILRDVAGSGNLTSTKIYGSAAYHQMLGSTGLLSV